MNKDVVKTYLTEAEHKVLEERAMQYGQSVSSYIHDAIFESGNTKILLPTANEKAQIVSVINSYHDLTDLLRELRKVTSIVTSKVDSAQASAEQLTDIKDALENFTVVANDIIKTVFTERTDLREEAKSILRANGIALCCK